MQTKQITVEISRTFNLGNYNNIKPSVTILVHLDEDDDPKIALADASETAEAQILAIIARAANPQEGGSDDLPF